MQHQRYNGLFVLFFDPRVPTLFVLGSIVLAVLGNGVYSLLLAVLGTAPSTIGAIVTGALLILIVVTLGFRALVHIFVAKAPPVPAVPTEHKAIPHAGLILFVSEGRNTTVVSTRPQAMKVEPL